MALHLGMDVDDWPPDNIEELAKKFEDNFQIIRFGAELNACFVQGKMGRRPKVSHQQRYWWPDKV